jgi:hypothetical protein
MVKLDDSGQLFTIDAMFALILITVLIGISANAMDIAGNKIHDYSSEQSLQRVAADTADVLIKTPGSPENWEMMKTVNWVTPGLAELQIGTKMTLVNTLSFKKVARLKENPYLLKKMFPAATGYSIMIYPMDQSIPSIEVQNRNPPKDTADIVVVNRTILYDYMFMDTYISIKPDYYGKRGDGSEYFCTHSNMAFFNHKRPDFKNHKSGWICSPFSIELDDINSKDFYILTDPPLFNDNYVWSARWIIDKPDKITKTSEKFSSTPIQINTKISEFSGNNTREVFVLHVLTSGDPEKTFNTYLVGVPKGTPPINVRLDCMKPQPAFFVLKLWV